MGGGGRQLLEGKGTKARAGGSSRYGQAIGDLDRNSPLLTREGTLMNQKANLVHIMWVGNPEISLFRKKENGGAENACSSFQLPLLTVYMVYVSKFCSQKGIHYVFKPYLNSH